MTEKKMDIGQVVEEIRSHPKIKSAGMVLVHLGLVRDFNLKGQTVSGLTLQHDTEKIEAVRADLLTRPGIVDIQVRMNQGALEPGDPIMIAAVAGATRPDVFPVMEELIERLKKEASSKTEQTI